MDVNSSIADIAKALEKEKPEEGCELCELEKKTKWYFESKKYVVLDCVKCKCPMIVFRKHVKEARHRVDSQMVWRLSEVCDKVYGKGKWTLDKNMRSIPDHVHYHGRPKKGNK